MKSGRQLLREWMDRSSMNGVQAATHIGIHTTYLSQILGNVRTPGLTNALLIERATGIPVEAWAPKQLSDLSFADSETPVTASDSKS